MTTVNKEELKFKIDQLRKDKIIYGVESVATSFAMLFVLLSFSSFFPFVNPQFIFGLTFFVSVGYWAYVVIGNAKRLNEIRKLEKLLK